MNFFFVPTLDLVIKKYYHFVGKVLRKAMADFARNKQVILPGTIEDASVFHDVRETLQKLGYARTAPDPITTRK